MQIRGMHTLIRDAKTTKHDFIFYSDRMTDSRPFMKQVHKLNVCLISTNKHNMDVDES